MTTFWGAAIALAYFGLIFLAVGLCRARSKPAPKPKPRIHPTWADIHRRTAQMERDVILIVRTPRAVHCVNVTRETDEFIQSIYAQADQEKS